ncbi:hypothetical protein LHFGNBLO_004245 [Mesorhizobium sp. AR10]|uniref:hypothetical protein n=1 Tax=Mesorhizobium sp. AR10 TaxID=2865839 RepID=UPI00215E7D71|nr:hypothetical protein [Mesorhizobium sp. AR10]UVK37239.1 hypothetical protein LHFGNBLO_004245 [Mesorhizobium sp. AR10]
MFTSKIGRLRFFFYSAALLVAEIVTVVLCIAWTIGFEGLMNSRPGPGREGLATAILVTSLMLVLFRGNFAWRRSRDAQGSMWILWGYIVFSAIFAVLQAGTMLVYDFGAEDFNSGLNLLGFALLGLWVTLLMAKPAGVDIEELVSVFDFDEPAAPLGSMKSKMYSSPAGTTSQASASATGMAPAPSRPTIPGNGRPRPSGFGKRGLA